MANLCYTPMNTCFDLLEWTPAAAAGAAMPVWEATAVCIAFAYFLLLMRLYICGPLSSLE